MKQVVLQAHTSHFFCSWGREEGKTRYKCFLGGSADRRLSRSTLRVALERLQNQRGKTPPEGREVCF